MLLRNNRRFPFLPFRLNFAFYKGIREEEAAAAATVVKHLDCSRNVHYRVLTRFNLFVVEIEFGIKLTLRQ